MKSDSIDELQGVIAAFADGEPVDPGRLTRALSDPAGREYLIDLLILRGLVGPNGSSRPAPIAEPVRVAMSRVRWLTAAAALAAVSVLGGYVAGQRTVSVPRGQQPAPPAVIRDVVPVSAPVPTRVIRLETGVDWTERPGGH